MITNAFSWLKENQDCIYSAQVKSLTRIDGDSSPIYVLYKKIHPLEDNSNVYLGGEVDLPVGRVFNIVNSSICIGYLFELPRKKFSLSKNYFSLVYKEEKFFSDTRVAFVNKDFCVLSPKSNNAMLVVLNDRSVMSIQVK